VDGVRGRGRVAWALLCVCVVALCRTAAAQELCGDGEVRATFVYDARQRSAQELAPLAEAALGGRGSALATGTGNSILLSGDPQAVREALRVLEALDRSPRTVVLHYESRRSDELDAAGLRVLWSAALGLLRVGNVRSPAGGTSVRVAPFGERRREGEQLSGTLRVLEGGRGRIATGALVPVRIRQRVAGRLRSTPAWVEAESGFEARPRVLGDGRVQIEIAPFAGELQDDGRVATRSAATTVVVEPGETLAIGAIESAVERSSSAVPQLARESERGDLLLLLRVELD
jgi:hypothetical protein